MKLFLFILLTVSWNWLATAENTTPPSDTVAKEIATEAPVVAQTPEVSPQPPVAKPPPQEASVPNPSMSSETPTEDDTPAEEIAPTTNNKAVVPAVSPSPQEELIEKEETKQDIANRKIKQARQLVTEYQKKKAIQDKKENIVIYHLICEGIEGRTQSAEITFQDNSFTGVAAPLPMGATQNIITFVALDTDSPKMIETHDNQVAMHTLSKLDETSHTLWLIPKAEEDFRIIRIDKLLNLYILYDTIDINDSFTTQLWLYQCNIEE